MARSHAQRKRRTRRLLSFQRAILFAVASGLFLASPKPSDGSPSELCENASQLVARETGVPLQVLLAISLTETGRNKNGKSEPWPWTVNMEGKSFWFDTEDDARSYVYEHYKNGARSFDVGCYQLNYKWHHEGFSSIDEMFDPVLSARYAAGFLGRLYDEKGNWRDAAGAYHSRTPEFATKYMARFAEYFENIEIGPAVAEPVIKTSGFDQDPQILASATKTERVNSYPLLIAQGSSGRLGSLFPDQSEPVRGLEN